MDSVLWVGAWEGEGTGERPTPARHVARPTGSVSGRCRRLPARPTRRPRRPPLSQSQTGAVKFPHFTYRGGLGTSAHAASHGWTRHATSVRQGDWGSLGTGPVPRAAR